MDIDFIERLIELAKKAGIAGLEYEAEGAVVRISMAEEGVSGGALVAHVEDKAVAAEEIETSPALHRLTSGMMGTFYRAPSPGAEPFVKQGDAIEEGQVLGLIEAMKMLTPIEADRAGRIVSIAVGDGEPVTRGALLFEIGA
jgi:acetyl-CoA carboxylase biotin carboxyl carrier protein